MVVVFIALLVLIAEDDILLPLLHRRLENLVGPRVLLSPTVALVLVLEVVVSDIGIPVGNADVDAFVLEHSRDLLQHLLGVLLGVASAPT